MWFNIAVVGGAALSGAVVLLPVLEPLLTPAFYATTLFVVGIANVALRSVTSNGIGQEDV